MKRTRSQTKADSSPDDSQPPIKTPTTQISFRARKIPRLTVKNKEPEVSTTITKELKVSTIIAKPLSLEGEIEAALNHLRAADPFLATCIDSFRPPRLSSHVTPFFSLIRSIISQQLSNKASASIETRFISLCGGHVSVRPDVVLSLSPQQLRQVGDLVVRRGVERLYGLKALPSPSQMERLCQKWKPYRSVGSWYMYRLVEAKGVLPTATTTPR